MQNIQESTRPEKLRLALQLTRWRHHVPFVVPLTIIGAMMAVETHAVRIDWRLAFVILGNILLMSAAFVINDLADAEDDARDPEKAAKNVISNGQFDYDSGMLVYWGTVAFSLIFYLFGGAWALFWGTVGHTLAYMYSMSPFRLKARPVVDVVTHAVGAGSLLVLIGYFLYSTSPGSGWYIILGLALGSAYGQFYNQMDDYQIDRAAGLRNTTQLCGEAVAKVLMYLCLLAAVACFGLAIASSVFPPWLGTVVVGGGVACSMFIWKTDMRGNEAGLHALQVPVLLIFNLAAMLWLADALGLMVSSVT
jgi:lycopene elongase/hydratase (dihydrobisanhydrobacterioruberin-forming)